MKHVNEWAVECERVGNDARLWIHTLQMNVTAYLPMDAARALFELLDGVVNGFKEVGSQRELAGASPAAHEATAEPLDTAQPVPAAETL